MYNNNFQVDYTCPGFCSKCFAEIAEFRGSHEVSPGVFRPIIVALKPTFRTQTVYLSDDSQMMVSLCDKCFDLTPEDLPKLMENEVAGWKKEVEHFRLTGKEAEFAEKAANLSITDVPFMKWDIETKSRIAEAQIGTSK